MERQRMTSVSSTRVCDCGVAELAQCHSVPCRASINPSVVTRPPARSIEAPLSLLGNKVEQPARPEDAIIECIPWDGAVMCVRFTAAEFTSLCPMTGQPDFARIVIDYVPDKSLVESKALKLYLGAFRNEGSFHEKVIDTIGRRLFDTSRPYWMRVCGLFFPRGGIPIDVFWMEGDLPERVFVPTLDEARYQGR